MEKEKNCTCNECECTPEENCGCMESDKECSCNECECTPEENCGCIKEETCKCNDKKAKKEKKNKKNDQTQIIEKLNFLNKEYEEKALRAQAELINYRKRKDEEMSRMYKYASEDVIKEILPTIDNFERAILLDDANLTDELSKFLSGFKMIYASLKNVLDKYEVKAIDSTEVEFDPSIHQAVLTEKIDGMESGKIIDILQKGYMLKDKVIRPAMVKVSE
ncbi:MAG: nucleotide exchange factor GrpE [Mycoplasmatota bacterium]